MRDARRRRPGGPPGSRNESGYSLAEALIAIAIIGIISLVAVPNFMQFMRAGKIKTAVRQFTGDLRGARQLAVARNLQTKISFATGPLPASAPVSARVTYTIWQRRGTQPWIEATVDGRGLPMNPVRQLEESIYFNSSSFSDVDSPADGKIDVAFRPNGTLLNPAGTNNIVLKTGYNIPKNQFQVEISPAGAIRAN